MPLKKSGHTGASKQTKSTGTRITACKFPDTAQWIALRDAKESVPNFSMQSKAFGLFRHGHIQKIKLARDDDNVYFECDCLHEMKNDSIYKLKLSMVKNGNREGEILFCSCICPAGKGPLGSCKHIAALCYALEEFSRLKCSREFDTCTSRLQTWNQPRKRKLDPQTVYDIDFSKKIYKRVKKKNPKPLTDPRRQCDRNNDSKKVNTELLEKVKVVKPDSAFFCLLSNEKHPQKENAIISPIKEHPVSLTEIFNRAERVKRNLMVDEQKKTKYCQCNIIKKQSKCKQWYLQRHIRITASKCKRALIKPTTNPTKAIREILHYNGDYKSAMMKQGLEDEKQITTLYENKMGCGVNETGFIISKSHP